MFDCAAADFVSFSSFLKALPSEEGGQRFIYFEASNESPDFEGERILAKALEESADYYLKYGNVDIDHITMVGPRRGIPDYNLYEVGRPVQVRVAAPKTFVKAQLYSGEGPAAEKANHVWDGLTKLTPPARWYPSVAGAIVKRSTDVDPRTREVQTTIEQVRWTNIGLSKTPVNSAIGTIATVPVGMLTKCWGAAGLNLSKALEAGYGTDSATLEGGAALRTEGAEPLQSYWDFRDRVAGDIRGKRVAANANALVAHTSDRYGLSRAEAAEWTERFMADLERGRTQKEKSHA